MKPILHAASLCAAEALSPKRTARTEVTDLRGDGVIDPTSVVESGSSPDGIVTIEEYEPRETSLQFPAGLPC